MPTIEQIRLFFEAVGILQIILGALVPIIGFVFWIFGIFPLFKRFGLGRWFRKIDIAADQSSYACLESDLLATGIFRKKNINPILPTNISKVADSSLLLINYNSFSVEEIRKILLRVTELVKTKKDEIIQIKEIIENQTKKQ